MEASLEDGRTRAKKKAPELESSIEAIKMLEAKQEAGETASAFYQLADNVFTKADIKPQNKVALWLGASVMVEYTYEEAKKLLGEQLQAARTKITNNTSDLTFLRDQIITTEVNRARVYNYTVLENRKAKQAAAAAQAAAGGAGVAGAAAPGSEPTKTA
jgi:prefoldin subunit 5